MPNFYVLFLALFLNLQIQVNSKQVGGKIVGGHKAKIEDYPYVVAIRNIVDNGDLRQYCGGIYIWERWVLTAAHCFMNYTDTETFSCGMGSEYVGAAPHTRLIEYVIEHSDFDRTTFKNDIAVIRLMSPFPLERKVAIVPYVNRTFANYKGPCTALGWGATESGTNKRSPVLNAANITIVNHSFCESHIGPTIPGHVFDIDTICAGTSLGENICLGDGGGPLMCDKCIVGIASVPEETCKFPGSFTNVSHFGFWIYKALTSKKSDLKLRPGASNIYIRSGSSIVIFSSQLFWMQFCLLAFVVYNEVLGFL